MPSAKRGYTPLHGGTRRAGRLIAVSVLLVGALGAAIALGKRASAETPAVVAARPARRSRDVPAVDVSPFRGTPAAMPGTQISFLGAPASDLRDVSVDGSLSGRHSGHLEPYSSAPGASFLPARPFTAGERVTVHATLRTAAGIRKLSTWFTVARPVAVSQAQFPDSPGTPADVQTFWSAPTLHPPTVTVTTPAGAVAPGLLFATPDLGPGQYGPMIFDNLGQLVWFRPLPTGEDAANLRVQNFAGRPDLTWWQGRTISLGYGEGEDVIANSAYQTVAVVKAGNGLLADEHEFLVTPQGSAYITAFSPVRANLSSANGTSHGIVLDGVIQEIDVKTGLVMWEWHSLGHVPLTDSYSGAPKSPTSPYDYFHPNSVFVAPDGNLIVSARNVWTIYEISKVTGRVIWRLGGRRSSFKLGPGVHFAWQHDAQLLPDGDLTLFDDEGVPLEDPPPRGEVLALDLTTHTASLVSQLWPADPQQLTTSQGDLQALPNGDWLVAYGGAPQFTEYSSGGAVVFDAQLPPGEDSYRIYRDPWSGQPTQPPAVAAVSSGATMEVYASWNGATEVSSWQLLSGDSPTDLAAVSVTPRAGFETAISAPAEPYVQVQALGPNGASLGASATVAPTGATAAPASARPTSADTAATVVGK